MHQDPETEAAPDVEDDGQDVEAHSLLVEAQGREMQARRDREARDLSASHRAHSSKKTSRSSRLRRLLGG